MLEIKKIQIYEQASCCTKNGITQKELDRFSNLIDRLKEQDISVERYNLSNSPLEFVNNKIVHELLYVKGTSQLPIIVVNNVIIMTSRYPTDNEFLDLIV